MACHSTGLTWRVVAVLGFGLFRGRKNGMTKELLPLFQWVVMVLACGLGYEMLAGLIVRSSSRIHYRSYIVGYLALALVVFIVFAILKQLFAES